jgi:hypothetical protein
MSDMPTFYGSQWTGLPERIRRADRTVSARPAVL